MIYFSDFSSSAGWSATLTVGSGETASDLLNYPLYVDLDDMPSGFWAATNEGKDMRAYIGATQLPVDVVWCSVAEGKGAAFIKVPTLAAASSTVITLQGNGTDDRLVNGHTYGRNAVWSDYHAVFLLGETAADDRTGGAQGFLTEDPDLFEKIETSTGDLNSHQGICWDGTYYYTTDTNAIYKWDASWNLVDSNTNPIADAAIGGSPTVNHMGDIEYHNGKLYSPLECYPASGGLYNAHMTVWDAATLNFDSSFSMTAQGHEAASVAYCPVDGYLYVVDYDANYNKLWKYSLAGSYIGQTTMDRNIQTMQGITWWRDYFWISENGGETHRVSYAGAGTTDGPTPYGTGLGGGVGFGQTGGGSYDYEGIGHRDDALVQLIDPGTTERAEVWRPLRMAKAAQGGASFVGSTGGVVANARSSYQTYTLGCTLSLAAVGANRCALSYVDESTAASSNRRQVIAYRHTNTTLAIWDVNNSWLEATVNPTLNTSYRVHARYQGSTSRQIFVDGVQKATAGPITAVPNDLDTLIIGYEDADKAERMSGKVGFVYLRGSALSADWIAAEYSNLNAPSGFYSIT